jgi:TonB family protein
VVKGSGGPAVRVGNTTYGDPNGEKFVKPEDVKGYAGGKPGFKAAKASTLSKEAAPSCKIPPYPKELADQNIEGVTGLLLEVDSTGTLRSVRVTRSSGSKELDDRALKSMRTDCTFKPAEVDGVAVDSLFRYSFRWELYN